MARGRGGPRTPERPAPVSGPGALAQRTDGGPGSQSQPTQPIRAATGQPYGEAGKQIAAQQAVPLPDNTPSPLPPSAQGPGPGTATGPALPPGGVFGPTARPGEPPLTGAAVGGSVLADDPDAVLRMIYAAVPHPALLRLIRGR